MNSVRGGTLTNTERSWGSSTEAPYTSEARTGDPPRSAGDEMAKADEMDLTFEDATVGTWNVLSVAGELDMHTSPALQERLDALSVGDSPKVAVDLSDVPFMDSSSLGMLVSYHKRLLERGGDLAIVGVAGSPQKVLSITGIDRVIPIFDQASELPQD